MRFLRGDYKPGADTLAYAAMDMAAATVVARVYPPHQRRQAVSHTLKKLEAGVFVLDFNFEELGNYIFVVDEDGTMQTILNAKVYA